MPFTAATLTDASTGLKKVFTLISSATTDGSGANTVTIAHGFAAAQRISANSDATNRIIVSFEPILPQGGISGWYVVAKDATNIVVSKNVSVAGSADNAAQVRMTAQVIHSLVE